MLKVPEMKIVTFANSVDYKAAYNEIYKKNMLTLKAPIKTAADDTHKYFLIVFQRKLDLMFQVNPLLSRGFR